LTPQRRRLAWTILILLFTRTVINLPRRFAYPFLPEISRQLDVPLSRVQQVMAAQTGIGIIAPVFAPVSERYGRKNTLLLGLSLLIVGGVCGGVMPTYGVFYLVLMLMGLGKVIFDPAMQAYVGDMVSYRRRGMVVGAVELSWSLSLFISAPTAGFLLARSGLGTIFWLLSGVSLLGLIFIRFWLPDDRRARKNAPSALSDTAPGEIETQADSSTPERPTPPQKWRLLWTTPAALGALAYASLLVAANEMLFIVYGAWMETSFDLKLTALGIVSMVIALAEVSGEFAVIGLADRFGKQKMAVICAGLASICYLGLPFIGVSLPMALGLLFALFLGLECAIVSSLSLFTEVLPNARAIMMTAIWAAHSLGRVGGATVGGILYAETASFALVMSLASLITLIATFILWRFVPENH
jgi:predicted MFS family arabinose efflux permease